MLRGSVHALEFAVQFINAFSSLLIFPTFHVRRPAEAFFFYHVDLFLDKFREFTLDTLIGFHAAPQGERSAL
jgi:hypothetical protein